MRRRAQAAASVAAAAAAAAAFAGAAAAQDEASGLTTAPDAATATPAEQPTVTTPQAGTAPIAPADGTTDLGTFQVQVEKRPAVATNRSTSRPRRPKDGAKQSGDTTVAQDAAKLFGLAGQLLEPPTIGVPNVLIDSLSVPPFLLPIYQAAGIEYGVRWEVLAAINEIETNYGRNLSISTAGAVGWMQFMPATWATYGVDANGDGERDPYNPVDAIFAAARYLHASGAGTNLKAAIYSYNHAGWYVDDVIAKAQALASLPSDVVGSLTGLTSGRFPLTGDTSYAGAYAPAKPTGTSASVAVAGQSGRRSIDVYARSGASAIAVQDGQVVRIGRSERLGQFVQLRDAYGNTYTYAHLGSIAEMHAVPRETTGTTRESAPAANDPTPTAPATAGTQGAAPQQAPAARRTAPRPVKERLFANPQRPRAYHAGGERQLDQVAPAQRATVADGDLGQYFAPPYDLRRDQVVLEPLRQGSHVVAGTILGQVGDASIAYDRGGRPAATAARKLGTSTAPHLRFEIRPAGNGAPRIDPGPVLDGWKLLATSNVYGSQNPLLRGTGGTGTIGQILLMSKEALEQRVLNNAAIDIYACGRQDIAAGIIDRRVLATLEYLAAGGLKPTVSTLRCGHGYYTTSGNVSEHSSGNGVDIGAINGVPIIGHQGEGSITDITVRRLLGLQGALKPHQIITLMQYANTDNTFAMGDHADHIHVGFQPLYGTNDAAGKALNAVLAPSDWKRISSRLAAIQNPTVASQPSRFSLKVQVKLPKK